MSQGAGTEPITSPGVDIGWGSGTYYECVSQYRVYGISSTVRTARGHAATTGYGARVSSPPAGDRKHQ